MYMIVDNKYCLFHSKEWEKLRMQPCYFKKDWIGQWKFNEVNRDWNFKRTVIRINFIAL